MMLVVLWACGTILALAAAWLALLAMWHSIPGAEAPTGRRPSHPARGVRRRETAGRAYAHTRPGRPSRSLAQYQRRWRRRQRVEARRARREARKAARQTTGAYMRGGHLR